MHDDIHPRRRPAAVLCSGGLDSAVLCGEMLRAYEEVVPTYVRFGLRWEDVELHHLRRFLEEAGRTLPGLRPLVVLDQPVADVYGTHWSLAGGPAVPSAEDPHDADFLPGRNVLLVAKAAVWCRLHGIDTIALGTLRTNPHPDSTPAFFDALETTMSLALGARLRVARPFATITKVDVVQRGAGLPLHLTFSCVEPVGLDPCGTCIKCGERRDVFRAAGLPDQTRYAATPSTPPSP